MKDHLIGTDEALWKWGRWGQGPNLGLPTISPMFGERCLKSPIWGADAPHPEVEQVDKAVKRLTKDQADFIRRRYMLDWKVREFMATYHWRSPRHYYREVERMVQVVYRLMN